MFTPLIVDLKEDMTPNDEKEINVGDLLDAQQRFNSLTNYSRAI